MHPGPSHLNLFAEFVRSKSSPSDAVACLEEQNGSIAAGRKVACCNEPGETGADELMIVSDVFDHEARLHSYRLIAEAGRAATVQ